MNICCKHCGGTPAHRQIKLCRTCYTTPEIREQYRKQLSKTPRVGSVDCMGRRPCPEQPTAHLPGTAEKIAVLAERYQKRQALHHPQDAKHTLVENPTKNRRLLELFLQREADSESSE